jgi:hypothetical protein
LYFILPERGLDIGAGKGTVHAGLIGQVNRGRGNIDAPGQEALAVQEFDGIDIVRGLSIVAVR